MRNLIFFVISILLILGCSQKNQNITVVMPSKYESDAGYNLALKELRLALENNNYLLTTSYVSPGNSLPKGNKIIVGNFEADSARRKPFKNEAYRIFRVNNRKENVLQIEGDAKGLMYGMFKIAEELKLNKNLRDISLEMAPDFPLRMYTEVGQLFDLPSIGYHLFESPWVNNERFEREKKELKLLIDEVVKMGFNAFTILHVNFEDYITYHYLNKEIYGKDDVHRLKAKQFAAHLIDVINYAHERHVEVYLQVYEFQYPPKLAELYDLDLANPEMKTIIEAKVKELFEEVPLDGLVITATESLPRSGYKSVEPWRKYGKAGAGEMMTMYHNAGKVLGKKIIFRSWMVAYGAEDSEQVIENTPQDAQFEIKHTGDDFWLNFPLTDAIEEGLGKKRPLTMTFDVYPQYYGWSRLLCYQQRFAEETKIAMENGVIGIQAWGAWAPGCIWRDGHPGYLPGGQLKSHDKPIYDMAGPWNNFRMFTRGFTPGQMNAYLVSRLTWNANLTAKEIADDWGTIHFGKENADALSELLMNSEAAFRSLYFNTGEGGKREFSFHPTYLKWATTVNIRFDVLNKMFEKIPLSDVLEQNRIGYKHLENMQEAFKNIDSTKISDPIHYKSLKESLNKTLLYISMFFEFREMWWRKRELDELKVENPVKQKEYDASFERFNKIMDQWKKYPEESKYWGINQESFSEGGFTWRNDVLRMFKP